MGQKLPLIIGQVPGIVMGTAYIYNPWLLRGKFGNINIIPKVYIVERQTLYAYSRIKGMFFSLVQVCLKEKEHHCVLLSSPPLIPLNKSFSRCYLSLSKMWLKILKSAKFLYS